MKAFEFLRPKRQEKPRNFGITVMLDKGIGAETVKDLMEIGSEYVDFVKFGWCTATLCDRDLIKEKIEIYNSYDVKVMPGGTLFEVAYLKNKLDKYFEEAKDLGFEFIEISDGSINLSLDERSEIIENAIDEGFKVISEIGKKNPEIDKKLTPEKRVKIAKHDLNSGVEMVTIEARESGRNVGVYDQNGNVKKSEVEYLISKLPVKKVIWEAPQKDQQTYFIIRLGPNVNLGNIPPEDIIAVETIRRGLRGDTIGKVNLE